MCDQRNSKHQRVKRFYSNYTHESLIFVIISLRLSEYIIGVSYEQELKMTEITGGRRYAWVSTAVLTYAELNA